MMPPDRGKPATVSASTPTLEPPGLVSCASGPESGRLRRLVDDLQKVSRAEERQLDLRLRPISLTAVVEAAAQAAGPAYAAKGIALETAIAERLPELAADPDRIGEVLANILDNALRHTPTGGRVEVRAARRSDEVELTVADTGEGIPPGHLSRVFERFYRIDSGRTRPRRQRDRPRNR